MKSSFIIFEISLEIGSIIILVKIYQFIEHFF
jgi:hypothetical protein